MNHTLQPKSSLTGGFAMLFTVLIVGLILSIAISISNLTLKQAVLSNLAKDSQIAFYQADAAVECGLYQDTALGLFPKGSTLATVPPEFECGNRRMVLDQLQEDTDQFTYTFADTNTTVPCFSIIFDKSSEPYRVQGFGYNTCTQSARQVERALEVKY